MKDYPIIENVKRESRREKNNNQESISRVGINWYKPNYGKLPMKAYK